MQSCTWLVTPKFFLGVTSLLLATVFDFIRKYIINVFKCIKNIIAKKLLFSCETEYRYPVGCKPENCIYHAQWKFDHNTEDVEFKVSSKGIGRWTGVGLSLDGSMLNSDMYTGWVYNHKAYVTDRFSYGKETPSIDITQNIYNISGSLHDDIQVIKYWFLNNKQKTLF